MKTNNKIPIKCGYLMFQKDRLSISDNSKGIHIVIFVMLIASCVDVAFACVLNYGVRGPLASWAEVRNDMWTTHSALAPSSVNSVITAFRYAR